MEQSPSKLVVTRTARKLSAFCRTEGTLPYSQDLAASPYIKSELSSYTHLPSFLKIYFMKKTKIQNALVITVPIQCVVKLLCSDVPTKNSGRLLLHSTCFSLKA